MTLRITDTEITSDEVSQRAEWNAARAADGNGAWVILGAARPLAARCFDRNGAITAMTLFEEQARENPNAVLISSLESELHL
jgi:hypothetical protein